MWRDFWRNRETGQLYWWWRASLYLLLALALTLLLTLLFALALASPPTSSSQPYSPKNLQLIYACVIPSATIAFILAGIWAVRAFDGLPPFTLGLSMRGVWLTLFLSMAAMGIFLGAVLTGACHFAGITTITFSPVTAKHTEAVLILASSLLLFGICQEVMIHGYLFQTLLRGVGPVAALCITALLGTLFMEGRLGHLEPISITNSFIEFLLLGMLYLRTASLWAPIGLYLGWHLVLVLLTTPPLPAAQAFPSPITAVFSGPGWLTGGKDGLESGLIISILLLTVLIVISSLRYGLSLASRWWHWQYLTASRQSPPAWDFAIGQRHYQWKLSVPDHVE